MKQDKTALERKFHKGTYAIEDCLALGKIYFESGEYQKIIKIYDKAEELQLTVLEKGMLLYEKGHAKEALGDYEGAIECYRLAASFFDKSDESCLLIDSKGLNYYSLAVLLADENDKRAYAEKSLESFQSLLNKCPDYEISKSYTYSYMAELHNILNDYDAALKSYLKAKEHCRDNYGKSGILSGLAATFRNIGDYKEAEKNYKDALSVIDDEKRYSKLYFDIGEFYFDLKKDKEAIECFNKALEYMDYTSQLRHNSAYLLDILWHLGRLHYESEEYEQAIKYMSKALAIANESHAYYCNICMVLGHSYISAGNHAKAREYYNKALFSPSVTEDEKETATKWLREIGEEYNA